MWVVHKATEKPGSTSYKGSLWDWAGIRHLYRDQFVNSTDAALCAFALQKEGIGRFCVSRAPLN